jgi:hypothetical protein
MPMLFWLPNIIFVGIWQAIEDDMRGLRDAATARATNPEKSEGSGDYPDHGYWPK